MSVSISFTPPTMDQQAYQAVRDKLETGGNWPPKGLQVHVCYGEGNHLRVFEVFESQEALEAFGQILMPVIQGTGLDPGQPEVLPVQRFDRPGV